jgi:hypothetical protein
MMRLGFLAADLTRFTLEPAVPNGIRNSSHRSSLTGESFAPASLVFQQGSLTLRGLKAFELIISVVPPVDPAVRSHLFFGTRFAFTSPAICHLWVSIKIFSRLLSMTPETYFHAWHGSYRLK